MDGALSLIPSAFIIITQGSVCEFQYIEKSTSRGVIIDGGKDFLELQSLLSEERKDVV